MITKPELTPLTSASDAVMIPWTVLVLKQNIKFLILVA